MKYRHDHYVNYEEMTLLLKHFESQFSEYIQLESLMTSAEGREMWLATITNPATGDAKTKPAYWIDANTHAGEVTGTQCCLRTIDLLLNERESRPDIQFLLDNNVFYIVPRISVDGAELYLTTGFDLRSTIREWPHNLEEFQGIEPKDLDQNGEILTMRLKHPAGEFKVSEKDPRMMVIRKPEDNDPSGEYYRLFPEGVFKNYDGKNQSSHVINGIDLNRQYPNEFMPTGEQQGAGPYPMFQQEARVLVEEICKRTNIIGLQSYHTFSGVVLRPLCNQPDSQMNAEDLIVYNALGEIAQRTCGYKCISVHHDFRYDQRKDMGGGFFEWAYGDRGIIAFTTEIWSVAEKAGLEIRSYIDMFFKFDEMTSTTIVKWCDENLQPGEYFQEWREFDHPQLGPVEIGGWKRKFVIQNPPTKFLKAEVEGNVEFTLGCAKSNPRLIVNGKTVENLGDDTFKISLEITNVGYLATHGSQRALQVAETPEPYGKLELESTQRLVTGDIKFRPKHLPGYSRKGPLQTSLYHFREDNLSTQFLEWVVKGQGVVKLQINYRQGGILEQTFECL